MNTPVDSTELACKLASATDRGLRILDLSILMDDNEILSCLIERVGGSINFSQLIFSLNRSLKAKDGRDQFDRQSDVAELTTGIDNFDFEGIKLTPQLCSEISLIVYLTTLRALTDVSKPLRTTTMLHTAVLHDAKNIVKWILSGGPKQAFNQFLSKSPQSAAALAAQKLAKLLRDCQFQGISDQKSPSAALSAFQCGYLECEDKKRRSIFHIAISNNSTNMLDFILKTAKSLGLADAAMVSHCSKASH